MNLSELCDYGNEEEIDEQFKEETSKLPSNKRRRLDDV